MKIAQLAMFMQMLKLVMQGPIIKSISIVLPKTGKEFIGRR